MDGVARGVNGLPLWYKLSGFENRSQAQTSEFSGFVVGYQGQASGHKYQRQQVEGSSLWGEHADLFRFLCQVIRKFPAFVHALATRWIETRAGAQIGFRHTQFGPGQQSAGTRIQVDITHEAW